MSFSPCPTNKLGENDPRRFRPIQYLGPDATGLIRAMRLYFETGRAFAEGCQSLRDVSKRLEDLSVQGDYPDKYPCSVASVQRACARTEEFFQGHFKLMQVPHLLQRTGRGFGFIGFTELGWDAWRLIEAYLRSLGVLETTT